MNLVLSVIYVQQNTLHTFDCRKVELFWAISRVAGVKWKIHPTFLWKVLQLPLNVDIIVDASRRIQSERGSHPKSARLVAGRQSVNNGFMRTRNPIYFHEWGPDGHTIQYNFMPATWWSGDGWDRQSSLRLAHSGIIIPLISHLHLCYSRGSTPLGATLHDFSSVIFRVSSSFIVP